MARPVSSDPSCNTDRGVQQQSEAAGARKPRTCNVAEVKAKGKGSSLPEEGRRTIKTVSLHLRPVASTVIRKGGEPTPGDPSRSAAAGTRKVVIFARVV